MPCRRPTPEQIIYSLSKDQKLLQRRREGRGRNRHPSAVSGELTIGGVQTYPVGTLTATIAYRRQVADRAKSPRYHHDLAVAGTPWEGL